MRWVHLAPILLTSKSKTKAETAQCSETIGGDMFETEDRAEIEIPPIFGEPGTRLWPFVTLRLHMPWLYVMWGIKDDEGIERRQMACLSKISDLVQIAAADYVTIRDVNIVLPGHMTGKQGWTMEPLAEIWKGIEPDTDGQAAHVFVTASGGRYLQSGICDDEFKLEDKQRIFQSPCLKLDI